MKYFRSYKNYLSEAIFISKSDKSKNIENYKQTNISNKVYDDLYAQLITSEISYIEKIIDVLNKKLINNYKDYFLYLKNKNPQNISKGESLFNRYQKIFNIWKNMYNEKDIFELFSTSKNILLETIFKNIKECLGYCDIVDSDPTDIINIINDNDICLDFTILTYYSKYNNLESSLDNIRQVIKNWIVVNDIEDLNTTNLESIEIKPNLYNKLNMIFNLDSIKECDLLQKSTRIRKNKERTDEENDIINKYIDRVKTVKCRSCGEVKDIRGNFNIYIKKIDGIPTTAGINYICNDCK